MIEQRAAPSRHVIDPIDLDPPVLPIEPERDALNPVGEFGIEPELIAARLQLFAGTVDTKRPHLLRVWQHAGGLDMALDLQAAATEYLGWLQLEANRSPNTVRAYASELNKLIAFLTANQHSLSVDDLRHDDLRAYQRHLAGRLKSPASRARALVAVRSWLRWIAKEGLIERDLSNGITLPKLEQRLPKPIDPDELTRLLGALPRQTPHEKRDRALVQFLISTGCRISESLALDRTDFPRSGNRLVVTGKGSKQRSVYLTTDAREALEEYLAVREDACMALFVNFDRSAEDDRARRLTSAGARFIVRKLRVQLGAWSFKSPHVARHTAATTLLEVTGGDVRLVQEVLGHANLNTLQGYTKIVDSRKQDAYRRYQEFLDDKKAGR
jgi:site-specific recombinase XerD